MAHSPEKKAAVMVDLISGMSVSECSRKHGVTRNTVAAWREEIEQPLGSNLSSDEVQIEAGAQLTAQERRRVQFIEALETSLIETVASVGKLLKVVTQPEFVEKHPESVRNLFDTAHERAHGIVGIAERLQSIQNGNQQLPSVAEPELPERSDSPAGSETP